MTIASRKIATPAVAAPPIQNGFSLISNQKLLQLYTTMLQCRMIEERLRPLLKKNKAEIAHDAAGREAAIVGAALDLLPGDTLAPAHGSLVPCFVKGLPLPAVFASLTPGPAAARSPFAPLHIIPPSFSLAVQLNKAIRAAIANKTSKNNKIAIAFCGDSSASSSLLEEAMTRAGAQTLPILFVCHTAHDAEDFSSKANEHGLPGATVDANDAVAVYRVATEAIAHARHGSGPTLIECKPWCLPGQKDDQRLEAADSILNMEKYLTRKGLFAPELKSEAAAGFKRQLDAAVKAVKAARSQSRPAH
jgi:TPP-dependent pyruvate/acetoin dehydrogenase alpha subunit